MSPPGHLSGSPYNLNQFFIMKHQTQEHKHNESLLFLPSGFKNLGYIILHTGAVLTILTRIINLSIQSDLITTIAFTGLIISLICLTWAKENNDDELWTLIKLKATRISFLITILLLILTTITGGMDFYINSPGFIFIMLLIYSVVFKFHKMKLICTG